MNDNADDDEGGSRDNTWRSRYPKLDRYLRFSYDAASQRFHVFYKAELIERVSATEQLLYAMGFEARDDGTVDTNTYARYPPDLHGDVSSLYVYAPGLIEPVIVGDTTAPLLRIANVKGRPDDVVEDVYVAVQYHRLLVKEIAEIEIQIKTATNRICPFEYGNVILTLHFRKMPYF
ncbi:hypothetical protein AAVH_21788 [Aphelenchoides avenae]|nr:hypothetical protein AAVH_21788 [Aphelenchus avenae]